MDRNSAEYPYAGRGRGLLPDRDIIAFQNGIYSWFRDNRRSMPWRETHDPYRIFISEMMLQQTGVPRVLLKYPGFIERFPSFHALATSPFPEVLAAWQGLGYNRRALYIHAASRIVWEEFRGELPSTPADLRCLPGVGAATSGSIAAFAFNLPVVFIETNIRRVFIHYFFPSGGPVPDTALVPYVEATLDREKPREWYYALMDLGSSLKSMGENPNRRSSRYRRQSPFPGSIREARGRVLRELRGPSAGIPYLSASTGIPPAILKVALDGLESEGFLVCERGEYRIRGS